MKHLTASLAFCTALLCAVAVHAARIAPWTPGGDVCFLVPSDGSERLVRVSSGECDSFSWSATGELLSASNAVAHETFAYDPCGRLVSAETQIGTNEYATSWLRDAGGLATNVSYGTGMSVSREYDADGRLVAVRDWLGHEWTFSYDGEGKPLGGTSPDGRGHSFSYDAAGRLSSWSVAGVAGRSISRDAAGRRVRDTVTAGAMPTPQTERRANNTFDRAGRLIENEEWKMESGECGNLTAVGTAYAYDGSGAMTNATSGGETVFSAAYDPLGRLTSLNASAFAYDALGNRVRAGGHIWIPDHDDPLKRPLLECDETGMPLRAYIWGEGRLLGWIDMVGRDDPIAPPSLTVAHCDEQGSLIALTSADGTILHTAHYGPNGEDWGSSGENPTPFAWLGGLGVARQLPTPNSQLSTLYLTRHRLYAPALRRFLSSDPLGLSGGLNLYGYANGDPLSYIDPLGLSPWTRIGGFFEDFAKGFTKGDFAKDTGWGGTLGQIVGGLIPVYGQISDVRDTAASIKEVWDNPSSKEAWTGLGVTLFAWVPGFGDAAKGTYRGARNAVEEVDEAAMRFRHQTEMMKSTNGFARKQVDDVAREFGIKGDERKEFGKYIEMLKDDVDRMGGAQNYSYQELRRIAREFKGR